MAPSPIGRGANTLLLYIGPLTTTREKYIYNKVKDTFVLRCNLLNILGGSIVLNELLVDEKGNILKDTYINHIQFVGQRLLIGTSKDVYCYSVATQKIAKKYKR